MSTLAIVLVPHLIPAATIPAGLLERAMTEPLAAGRDEVIYLVCTHARVTLAQTVGDDGWRSVYCAHGLIGGPFAYNVETPWARVRLPEAVRPSELGWAVLDPLAETVEGLLPDPSFDASRDPEGEDGRHRQELLPWIFDRHLELTRELEVDRGEVQGGEINFKLEYIGKAGEGALRRASGPHHKVPLILARTLVYYPHRLVYSLPCDIRVATYEAQATAPAVDLLPLVDAVAETGVPRDLLIAAAEEALIAAVGAPENLRNTGARRFPRSDAGERLAAMRIEHMVLGFGGIPERVTIRGERERICRGRRVIEFDLGPS